ncbi:MAG: elongation factor G [Clostridiales bacterium]|nr:elongation factor G [Clostridiales bacterium]
MKGYTGDKIRNIALVGHGGCGKTTLLEAALLATGVTKRLGRVEDGNTVSDYDAMEIEKGYSITTSIVPIEYKGCKLNFVDTPGYFDYVGEVYSAMRSVEAAVLVVDASAGIQVGTEKNWGACKFDKIPTCILINKIDKDNVDVSKLFEDLRAKFGNALVLMDEPITEDLQEALNEAVAESDEELMEKFFEGEPFTEEEFKRGLIKGILDRSIVPVFTASAITGERVTDFLDAMIKYAPAPADHAPFAAKDDDGEDIEVKCDPAAPASAFVFKTIADAFLGKISLLKVITGELTSGMELLNSKAEKTEKLGNLFYLRGKTQAECPKAVAGDIVAVAKLQHTLTGDTLCDKNNVVVYPGVNFPAPSLFMAVEAKAKGEEDKINSGLRKLAEEDPSFVIVNNAETHQTLIGGQGEIQIGVITAKLKDKYGVSVNLADQKIPYRETIKGSSDVQGKHKKQTGGSGQYGDVHIKFSPSDQDFEFTEELFGGSVPKNYIPAVEKGLRECMEKGPLAGYPVVNVKAVLYDGSYHPVDSNEMAFKIAASLAFKKGIQEAKPVLLEPVMHVEIKVPDEYMGDVMGDMNKRRGKILGMEPMSGGGQKLIAEAPQAEMFKYAITLRSMTQARGSFVMNFERYEEVPHMLAEKIIAEAGVQE